MSLTLYVDDDACDGKNEVFADKLNPVHRGMHPDFNSLALTLNISLQTAAVH
jgi:hypothetical protein